MKCLCEICKTICSRAGQGEPFTALETVERRGMAKPEATESAGPAQTAGLAPLTVLHEIAGRRPDGRQPSQPNTVTHSKEGECANS